MAGPPPQDAELERISAVLTRLRILIGRRVISRVAIANVLPSAELSFIDALEHIPGPPAPDVTVLPEAGMTVGALAAVLRIDPSRASRLAAQMVEQELLVRIAAPGDARSSLLQRSPLGERLFQETQSIKSRLIEAAVEGWPAEDIETFARLFDRFIGCWEDQFAEGAVPRPKTGDA